ncbi:MAG TPA: prepilin-type N-terminal cleavage/methylation domain-containing protein [Verrucomicrobiae bacterium]|jgi:Tfp pilus assembly protein PilV
MKSRPQTNAAFTLLEVMIAVMIFFMCMFTILALVSSSLSRARALQQATVNPGTLAAQLSLTNSISEGQASGDFGELYPDFRWTSETTEAGTNGLFQVDFVIYRNGGKGAPESQLSILLFRPNSKKGLGRFGR